MKLTVGKTYRADNGTLYYVEAYRPTLGYGPAPDPCPYLARPVSGAGPRRLAQWYTEGGFWCADGKRQTGLDLIALVDGT